MAGSIVCAVDDSPVANDVIRLAAELRDRLGLRLVMAHAVPAPVPLPGATAAYAHAYAPSYDDSREAAEAILERVAGRSEHADGAELRPLVGDPVESVLSVAEEDEAELLVVGSRRRGALKAALLGSVSSALATRARCPVIIVPTRVSEPYPHGAVPHTQ